MAKDTQKDTPKDVEKETAPTTPAPASKETAKSKTVHPYTSGTIEEFGFFGNVCRMVLKGQDADGKEVKWMVSLRITQVVPPGDFETIYEALNNA